MDEILLEMKFAVDALGEDNFAVLEKLSKFLGILISHSDRNKMNLNNVVTCFAPTLKFTPAILSYTIQHHSFFFGPQVNAAPEELKTLVTSEHTRKHISPNNRRSVPNLNQLQRLSDNLKLEESNSDNKIKEEILRERSRFKDELHKEKKILKEEWHKEKQQLKEDLAKEKEYYQEELAKEKRRLKLEFSNEKRDMKEEIEKLHQELEVWKTIAQARKEKLEAIAEYNYELERKLKKQQLRKKALELDIEMLERKIKHLKAESSPMVSPRYHYMPQRDSDYSLKSKDNSSDNEREDPKSREKERNNLKKHSRQRSSSSSSSTNDKKMSAVYGKSDSTPIEGEKVMMSSKDKTKELLKKNTTKLIQESTKMRNRKSISLDLKELPL